MVVIIDTVVQICIANELSIEYNFTSTEKYEMYCLLTINVRSVMYVMLNDNKTCVIKTVMK